jgi:hypothetical protein
MVPAMTSEPLSQPRSDISVELSRVLHDAGLEWNPRLGDRFHVPDRDLDEYTFAISEMVVEVRDAIDGGSELAFNGTVEWALDSIR